MRELIRTLAMVTTLAVALLGGAAGEAAAQQERITNPAPVDPASPKGIRAREVVLLILAGDSAKLAAWMDAHAAPSYDAARRGADLAALRAEVASGLEIAAMDDIGQGRVGVQVRKKGSGASAEQAIMVSLEAEAPHRIAGLRPARIQIR
jgi:hypothetical protein